LRRNATADPGQPLEKEFDMNVTRFLESLAQEVGEERLEGAIVLLALKRPIDDLIRLALAAGPYHPGHRSPWSHTILVAGKFSGASTPILDCTIRADDGSILWDEPLLDFIKRDPTEQGGIYDGKLGDYDHARVTNAGVKLLDDLKPAEQTAILGKGLELQAAGYHYDIPGLVRELVRLLTGITIPAGEKLLFCSAFCQAAYAALGQKGDFAPQIATVDTTPDDIWYSARGRSIPSRKKAKAAKGAGLAAKEVQSAAAVRGLEHVNHIVVLMLENRSFDHLLGYLKAENPEIEGLVGTEVNPEDPGATPPIPTAVNDNAEYKGDLEVDPGHDQSDVGIELYGTPAYNFTLDPVNNGFVFDYIRRNQGDRVKGRKIMKCFAPSKLDALATLARQFAVCDHWFSSVPGPTWPNRFFAHAATSAGHVDNAFRFYAMDTIYHQLQTVGVSWGVYFHDIPQVLAISSLWGDMFKQRFHRFERFFEAARRGTLPAYSFLEPRYFEFFFTKRANDEHPPHDVLEGEQLISDVYNALRESPAWERTLLVVLIRRARRNIRPHSAAADRQSRRQSLRQAAVRLHPVGRPRSRRSRLTLHPGGNGRSQRVRSHVYPGHGAATLRSARSLDRTRRRGQHLRGQSFAARGADRCAGEDRADGKDRAIGGGARQGIRAAAAEPSASGGSGRRGLRCAFDRTPGEPRRSRPANQFGPPGGSARAARS
jgi:hypothetical protein